MYAVVFEVEPKPERWEDYLGLAGALRPELTEIEGFVENVRYRSRRRAGWVLSLSVWADEAALARWRAHPAHRQAQDRGRAEIFRHYRLRVGRVGEAGARGAISLIEPPAGMDPAEVSRGTEGATGLEDWDMYEALLTPGSFLLALSWRDMAAAREGVRRVPEGARVRLVATERDYGMFERAEAPVRR